MNTYRWFVAGSLVVSTSWFAGACGSSGDGGDGSGGKGNRGGDGGSGNASGSSSGGFGGSVGGVSGSSNGGGGPGGEGGEGAVTCASTKQDAELTPANLLFVIDKSGSMNCNPPPTTSSVRCADFPVKEDETKDSKWEITADALSNALDSLAEQPNVSAGLMLFPVPERAPSGLSARAESCFVDGETDVPVGSLDTSGRSDLDDVLTAVAPAGETPIVGATVLGYKYLSEAIRAGDIAGNHFIVLLTDGAETCEPGQLSDLVNRDVPNARLWNIRTFVIGAPGSENARSLLSQIAWEGGTASSATCNHAGTRADRGDCHFDMTESIDLAGDLNDALQAISRTTILACEFDVPENPDGGGVDLDKVNVTFTPGSGDAETILKTDGDCATEEGWQYSPDFAKIVLCGDICSRVQADSQGEVSIELGCPTVVR